MNEKNRENSEKISIKDRLVVLITVLIPTLMSAYLEFKYSTVTTKTLFYAFLAIYSAGILYILAPNSKASLKILGGTLAGGAAVGILFVAFIVKVLIPQEEEKHHFLTTPGLRNEDINIQDVKDLEIYMLRNYFTGEKHPTKPFLVFFQPGGDKSHKGEIVYEIKGKDNMWSGKKIIIDNNNKEEEKEL